MARAGPDMTRLRREIMDLQRDSETSGVGGAPRGEDLRRLDCTIKGPVGTPYEGGVFEIFCEIPDEYPFRPPKMKFVTRIWHPNISSQTGAICLDILKDEWSPALTVKTALVSLQALLSAPEPDDPQDAEVAGQYKRSLAEWSATARFWTETYAVPRAASDESAAFTELASMGFPEAAIRDALKSSKGSLEGALEILMRG